MEPQFSKGMASGTPRTRRSSRASKPNTPGGDISVASRSSTSSTKTGVPANIQKQLAQELERAFPIESFGPFENSAVGLLNSERQALSKFLDKLVEEDPDNNAVFGERGEKIRDKIGDLIQYWKKKSREEYRRNVVNRLGIKLEPVRKATRPIESTQGDDVSINSDLTQELDEPQGKNSVPGDLVGSTISTAPSSTTSRRSRKKTTAQEPDTARGTTMTDSKMPRYERAGKLLIGEFIFAAYVGLHRG